MISSITLNCIFTRRGMAMTTTELQQLIIAVLKRGHHVTSDQLHALANSELAGMGSPGVLKQRFTRVLQDVARTGVIERILEGAPPRYRMALPPRYATWSPGEGYPLCQGSCRMRLAA